MTQRDLYHNDILKQKLSKKYTTGINNTHSL